MTIDPTTHVDCPWLVVLAILTRQIWGRRVDLAGCGGFCCGLVAGVGFCVFSIVADLTDVDEL